MKRAYLALAIVATVVAAGASSATARSVTPAAAGSATAFAFSGALAQPNGAYDFKFQLYDAPTNGSSVAGPVTVTGVAVAGDVYSTPVDFGSDPFTGSARFMQVSWRKAGTGKFKKLSQRVEILAAPYALGLRLPATESASLSGPSMTIGNTGSGDGLNTSSASGYGATGWTTTGFAGIGGFNNGPNNGLYGEVGNSGGSGVYGHNKNSGNGVGGISEQGYGVAGLSNGGFAGVYGAGPRNGVYGDANNATDSGVYGHNGGSGNGVAGISDGGSGGFFQGTTGAYLKGGGGSNAALVLDNGGINVHGVGLDSPTPVFWHDATTANVCDGGKYTPLDNPYLNGNEAAIVILTGAGMKKGYGNLQPVYNTGGNGDCPTSRWLVTPDFNNWDTGYTNYFYVLVFDY